MAHKDEYLTYYIVLPVNDAAAKTVLTGLQAMFPKGINVSPLVAAAQFSAPFRGYTDPNIGAPYTWVPWSKAATTGYPYPIDGLGTFSRRSGGFLGIGGTTTTYHWIGMFLPASGLTEDPVAGVVVVPDVMPVRRWADGFEVPKASPASQVVAGVCPSRDASRHVGGMGLALRSANAGNTINLNAYTPGLVNAKSWERFYIRLRKAPSSTPGAFWRCQGSGSPNNGAILAIDTSGRIALYSVSSTAVATYKSNIPSFLTVGEWLKIDIFVGYADQDAGGHLKVYVNGTVQLDLQGVSFWAGSGLGGTGGGHASSTMGSMVLAQSDLELDVDDWINAAQPASFSRDWLNGTKIALCRANAFSGNHSVNWAGDIRVLAQNPHFTAFGAALGSTTSGALAAALLDDALVIDADKQKIGAQSMLVSMQSSRGTTDGTLGYSLNGAAPVMAAVTQLNGVVDFQTVFYPGNSSATFPDLTPIELRSAKGADVTAAQIRHLGAQVELIGIFGREDWRATEGTPPTFAAFAGIHNAPYPRSPWAQAGLAPPISPYIIKTGTYVGNNTGQDLSFRAPVNLFFVRPLTGGTGGFQWWSSMGASHQKGTMPIDCEISDCQEDLTFAAGLGDDTQQQSYRVRIAGSNTQLNATGVTYQYVAIIDPGQRFMLNGTLVHDTAATDQQNPLINAAYTPQWMFLLIDAFSVTTTLRLYGKGPGNATETLTSFGGTPVASALSFNTGRLDTKNALHVLQQGSYPFSLFRRSDGNNDPGEPAVVSILNWVGDGSASRTVGLTPATGKRPIYAIVFTESGVGFLRDPSHTGTTSSDSTGTINAATGITGAGIDTLSVGSALNANGVIYNAFVLVGNATAGNGGFGVDGEYIPVEMNSPVDGPWPTAPLLTELNDGSTVVTPPAPTVPGDITTDVASGCVSSTQTIANIALSRIGISNRIAAFATELTQEADECRLHFGLVAEQTLRDFPWPFATRYANLVLVGGTSSVPVNADWQYSYRSPTSMLRARRLVGQAGQQRGIDLTPLQFREGSDATGSLIYSNAVASTDVPLVLEYTIRLGCPASSADPLFRSALTWHLAAAIAPALSRDQKRAEFCEGMYRDVLRRAEAVTASEQQQAPGGDPDWITGRN